MEIYLLFASSRQTEKIFDKYAEHWTSIELDEITSENHKSKNNRVLSVSSRAISIGY